MSISHETFVKEKKTKKSLVLGGAIVESVSNGVGILKIDHVLCETRMTFPTILG